MLSTLQVLQKSFSATQNIARHLRNSLGGSLPAACHSFSCIVLVFSGRVVAIVFLGF
jgi:hypothetical protein